MSRSLWAVFLAAILGLVGVGGTPRPAGAASSGTVSVKLSDIPVGKVIQVGNVKFVKVGADQYLAINLCPDGSTYMAEYKGCVVKQTNFAYTGGEQTFTAPASGYYVLEVWGAQGGGAGPSGTNVEGGYGGYSIGIISLATSQKIYVNVGGSGKNSVSKTTDYPGGYNGGGYSYHWRNGDLYSGSGGGATHVATVTGELKNLSAYQNTGGTNISKQILIVAGAGGGSGWLNSDIGRSCDDKFGYGMGGNGGGMNGNDGTEAFGCDGWYGKGGTQVAGGVSTQSRIKRTYLKAEDGVFGKGGDSNSNNTGSNYGGGSAGGSGWFGGAGSTTTDSAGGGSGYIGSSSLVSLTSFTKHMTCYSCTTSTAASTYTISNTCADDDPVMDCAKKGNGHARITQLSVYLGI